MEVLKYHSPKKVLEYALENKLSNAQGWEWIQQFLKSDEQLLPARKAYMAAKKESKFMFGVEVAMSPKHALELDIKEGNNLWKDAIKSELDQIKEYKTF